MTFAISSTVKTTAQSSPGLASPICQSPDTIVSRIGIEVDVMIECESERTGVNERF